MLKVVATIVGVGAASGLFYRNDAVYLISDNSNYLYQYSLTADSLSKVLLVNDDVNEEVKKKQKRDFEAISVSGDTVRVYGSGSSDNGLRDLRITGSLTDTQAGQAEGVTSLYARLRDLADMAEDDFNIEGAVHQGGQTYLFNRGNGPGRRNGVFKLDAATRDTTFVPVALPELDGAAAAFTDAILLDDTLYFLAAAEATDSAYGDGAIHGTLLGRLSLADLKLLGHEQISSSHKFEGITLVKQDATHLTFLLCEDADNGETESKLYSLTVNRY